MGNVIDIDTEVLYDQGLRGLTRRQAAGELGISTATLSRRMADVKSKQGLLTQYRAIQSLQLTELQARILEAITPEKIEDASLADLVKCYRLLKDKEDESEMGGKMKGLLSYLLQLEKEEVELRIDSTIQDAEFTEVAETIQTEDDIPNL